MTRETTLAHRAARGDGWWLRLRGLMLRRDFGTWDGLWLARNNAVHMWLVFFAIDLVWLDRERAVVGLVPGLRPWRLAWQRGADSCLELPVGAIERSGTETGDRLEFAAEVQ